jgi:hypothetical protein
MIIRHSTSRTSALGQLSGAGARSLFDGLDAYAAAEMRGFSGFGARDATLSALGVIGKVRLAYAAGGAVQAIIPLDFQDLLAKSNPLTALFTPDVLVSPSKGALAKAYRDLGVQIDDWANRKYRWAQAGRRDDGSSYSWKQWADLGQVYLGSIQSYTKIAATDSFMANAITSMAEFVESIRQVFTPTEWPGWAKAAAGLAGLAALAYITGTFTDTAKTIRGR